MQIEGLHSEWVKLQSIDTPSEVNRRKQASENESMIGLNRNTQITDDFQAFSD